MQQTRQHILEILKEHEEATVDDIVEALANRIGDITAVTVRHHLEILRGDGLVAAPRVRRRTTPGRPQHMYALTDKALELFPNNYRSLAGEMLLQLKAQLPAAEVNVILEGVADQMAGSIPPSDAPLPVRLNQVVDYLSEQGYAAYWEAVDEGFILHTNNCPYHQLAAEHEELCRMDIRMISGLLGGIVPRRVAHMTQGDPSCAYLIPDSQTNRAANKKDNHLIY
ncbi:MAG: ArsR family transcriptional regulator [Anaerolineae bacterium]|nr:ArsR family transcriptional regulator [Anaerolineae bacterium]